MHRILRQLASTMEAAPAFPEEPLTRSDEVAQALEDLGREGMLQHMHRLIESGSTVSEFRIEPLAIDRARRIAWDAIQRHSQLRSRILESLDELNG